ncbi:MAG: hypothetical protein ACOYMS_01060 [Terrimicrobiaceae bacterium]
MKLAGIFFGLALLVSPMAAARASIGLLPEDKTPVVVAEDERNPFGKRAVKAPSVVQEERESEETKIRALISKLPLGGMTRGYGVVKVLIGPYTVAEGAILPDMIPGQTERVKVLSVSADKVELGFLDKDGTADTRKINLAIDFRPAVRFKLGASSAGETKEGGASGLDGVTKKNDPGTSK